MRLTVKLAIALALVCSFCSPVRSNPLHPDILRKIRDGEIPKPYCIEHCDELRARGVNAPRRIQLACDIASGAVRQDFRAIAILVDFSDNVAATQASFFDTLLFGNQTGTLRDYWREVSYDSLIIVTLDLPSILGWLRVSQPYSYYSGSAGQGQPPGNTQWLAAEAVMLADRFVNFADYDNDGDGEVDALFIIHAGQSLQATGDSSRIEDITWRMGDSVRQVDGVIANAFSILSEYEVTPGDKTVGDFAHEMGHLVFGLPDLYDRNYDSQGLGSWSLMAFGGNNGPPGSPGASPAHPDAWSRIQIGMVDPTVLSANLLGATIPAVEDTPVIFYLWTNGILGPQSILVENRRQAGYDTLLLGQGLLIYHVDEDMPNNNNNQWYPGYTDSGHYLVALEQADGQWNLERRINAIDTSGNFGDNGDPYGGGTRNRTYGDSSTPDSRDYNFNFTGVAVLNISDPAPVMTADLYVTPAGALSGILGPGIFNISGDIWINAGDTLRIQPGTTLNFLGPYRFNIWGTLLAEGTETDSIVFTTDQLGLNRWQGLRFFGGASGSRLAYCLIEKAYNSGDVGGGVCCVTSSPSFTNCTLRGNWAAAGAGVYCSDSSPNFTNCIISNNWAAGLPGGGGVSANGYGSLPIFTNCVLSGNEAAYGGGLDCRFGSPTFRFCTLSGNSAAAGGGVCCFRSSVRFNSTIIAFSSSGAGVYFDWIGQPESGDQFVYCDIFGNSGGPFGGAVPAGLGQIVATNANDDPCDPYYNIFLDPLFVIPPTGDMHLTNGSRCINAANPVGAPSFDFDGESRPNPPGSYPDIGMDEDSCAAPGVCPPWLRVEQPIVDLVILIPERRDGNMVLSWSSLGAEIYNIYGATEPFASGVLLGTTSGTTWTDTETSSRPSPYFYSVTAEWPGR